MLHRDSSGKFLLSGLLFGFLLAAISPRPAAAQKQAESKNMELVGSNDLQGRSAYQPTIHKQGARWIAYVGHHGGENLNALTGKKEINGTSVVDVTDPRQPKYIAHIPGDPGKGSGQEAGGAQMVRVCDGSALPHAEKNKVYLLRSYGNSAQEIWDVTDPAKPTRLDVVVSGLRDTHKNFWECDTGIAYLVSGVPGWRTNRIMQVYDLSNPAEPVFIRNFGLPNQEPGSTGPVPSSLHGAISTGPKGNRIYLAYGTGGSGVVQILDRQKLLTGPKEPTDENLAYPQVSRVNLPPEVGAHTSYPLLGVEVPEFEKIAAGRTRDFVIVPGEAGDNVCQKISQMVHIFDITTESNPLGVSSFNVPEESGNFCSRGGRYGTHSTNENLTPIYYKRVVFVSYFNAGVRALDVRDPFNPTEIGYYIPAATDKTCMVPDAERVAAEQHCKPVVQTNNVEVDERGYIYIVDRANTGMHILQLTGAARQAADFSQAQK
jgi:hypothetical protein